MAKFIPVEPEKWEKMVKAWAENVRLETENAQLEHVINYWKIEAETDNARWLRVLEENARLKAEVERLTKAGDAMAEEMLKLNHPHASVYFWCKAKEGGQP